MTYLYIFWLVLSESALRVCGNNVLLGCWSKIYCMLCVYFIFNCGINGLVGLSHILTFYIDIRYSDIVQFVIFNTDTMLIYAVVKLINH